MIGDWHDAETEDVFNGGRGNRRWEPFLRIARRKLVMIEAATTLSDLRNPPGNRLEPMKKAERLGQHSIRINQQYRICFTWRDGHAYQIEITDYHDE